MLSLIQERFSDSGRLWKSLVVAKGFNPFISLFYFIVNIHGMSHVIDACGACIECCIPHPKTSSIMPSGGSAICYR
jgi:hypothetical protein